MKMAPPSFAIASSPTLPWAEEWIILLRSADSVLDSFGRPLGDTRGLPGLAAGSAKAEIPAGAQSMSKPNWYKGNIHTHTTESDGDASPEKVVQWYRRHGYDFLVLSDHNHLTLLDYGAGRRRFRRPLMIPGEEITTSIRQGTVPIHLNGIGISRVVEPIDAGEVIPTLQANVNAILEAGGIASINHPNFRWAFDHEAIKEVTGASLLEIYNGHPTW